MSARQTTYNSQLTDLVENSLTKSQTFGYCHDNTWSKQVRLGLYIASRGREGEGGTEREGGEVE